MKIVDGRHVGKLRVTIFYADHKGKYLGGVWKIVGFNLREQIYRQHLDSGIPFSIVVPLKVKKQIRKVIVYDAATDRTGSRLIRMK